MWFDRTRSARTFDGVDYRPGRKFRVVKTGLRLSGWKAHPGHPGAATGWTQTLNPGDIIECTGFGAGWGSDPGYGVEWTSDKAQADRAYSVDLWPAVGGVFSYRPPVGSVVPVDDEEVE